MEPIIFFVAGVPKAQPRPRAFARQIGGRVIARVYDAGTAEGWKGCVAIAARDLIPQQPIEAPVTLKLNFYFPRPKNHFLKSGLRLNAPKAHTSKPDFDNAAKAVVDAMTALGFWRDDAQIAEATISKSYSDRPGCLISVATLVSTFSLEAV